MAGLSLVQDVPPQCTVRWLNAQNVDMNSPYYGDKKVLAQAFNSTFLTGNSHISNTQMVKTLVSSKTSNNPLDNPKGVNSHNPIFSNRSVN
jgi:hypothetical protein